MNDTISVDMNEATICGVDTSLAVIGRADKNWRNFRQRARRNGYGLLKQILVDGIKEHIRKNGALRRNYDSVLVIDLGGCGGSISYKTLDDIPEVDVPCPCGNSNHWLIRYRDLR